MQCNEPEVDRMLLCWDRETHVLTICSFNAVHIDPVRFGSVCASVEVTILRSRA